MWNESSEKLKIQFFPGNLVTCTGNRAICAIFQGTSGSFGRVCIYGYKFVKYYIGTAEMPSYNHLLTLILSCLVNSIYCSESEQVKKIEMP